MTKTMSIKDRLKALSARRYTTVKIGDDEYRLGSLTALQKTEVEARLLDKQAKFSPALYAKSKLWLVLYSLVDEQGNQVLSPDDIGILEAMGEAEFDKLYTAAKSLQSTQDEAEKNSEAATD